MTESEWLECADPKLMLEFLRGKASDRKLRLFACACCRQVWHLLIDERSRVAVEAAERLSDRLLADSEAQAAFTTACAASRAVPRGPDASPESVLRLRRQHDPYQLWRAAFIAAFAVGSRAGDVEAHIRGADDNPVPVLMRSRLLCDIFGLLPFRSVGLDTAWISPAATALAQSIYEERRFEELPLLADALEEAGCTDADLLAHLRSGGPRARGCWALDLVLRKS
jgi:hypothetical protein